MATMLIDGNNLLMRNVFHKEINITSEKPEYNLLQYLLFDQIYWSMIKLNKKEYNIDEVVFCVDSRNSWRKLYFPRYKENRKKSDDIDWDTLFAQYDKFQKELREHLPFKVMKVSRCEADDIIGSLCVNLPERKFIIISTDSDFKQLLDRDNVSLYSPLENEFLKCKDVDTFKKSLYLKGQTKDSILNAKTPSDYPNKLRNPGLGDKTAEKILSEGLDNFLDNQQSINKKYTDESGNQVTYQNKFYPRENYKRNQVLIDFEYIPKKIVDKILSDYGNYEFPDPNNIQKFFNKMGWRSYIESIDITEKVLLKLYN